jgi:hypothetical protein
VVTREEVEDAAGYWGAHDGAVGLGISLGSGKSPVPSPAASATALAVVLPPDVLYHETQHNVRTLTFRDTHRKAIQ